MYFPDRLNLDLTQHKDYLMHSVFISVMVLALNFDKEPVLTHDDVKPSHIYREVLPK